MTKSLDIIVFGEDWGAHPSATQHLMTRLFTRHRVFWVNSLGLRRPRLTDHKRAFRKLWAMTQNGTKNPGERDRLRNGPHQIIAPRCLPWPGNRVVAEINRFSLMQQIEALRTRHQLRRPVFLTALPSAIDLLEAYPNCPVVYYCGDDFAALAGVDHAPVAKMEQRLAERAERIVTASPQLAERFPVSKTILLEHGVDYDHFATEAPRATDLPQHTKVAGFYGALHDWLDQEMIATAAAQCPEWTFLFIGEKHCDTQRLDRVKNVVLLGPRPHGALPSYAQHWDVGLLPFRDTPQIRACNPLKLREYLSAGRPIISTDFPATRAFEDKITLIRSAQELTHALQNVAPVPKRVPDRDMQTQSWDAKAWILEKQLLTL